MEEVREVGEVQYSKVAMMSPVNTIVFHDVDTDTTNQAKKRSAHYHQLHLGDGHREIFLLYLLTNTRQAAVELPGG